MTVPRDGIGPRARASRCRSRRSRTSTKLRSRSSSAVALSNRSLPTCPGERAYSGVRDPDGFKLTISSAHAAYHAREAGGATLKGSVCCLRLKTSAAAQTRFVRPPHTYEEPRCLHEMRERRRLL